MPSKQCNTPLSSSRRQATPKELYISEGEEHLRDPSTYKRQQKDPITRIAAKANLLLLQAKRRKIIVGDTYKTLRRNPDSIATQAIYFLSKTHKTPHQLRPFFPRLLL